MCEALWRLFFENLQWGGEGSSGKWLLVSGWWPTAKAAGLAAGTAPDGWIELDFKPGQTQSSRVKANQAESRLIKVNQGKSSQIKPARWGGRVGSGQWLVASAWWRKRVAGYNPIKPNQG
jgi:hypothetical protein